MSATALSAHDSHGHGSHGHGSYLERRGGFWTTVWDWATTIDHKKIGVLYLVAILSMFFIGGVAALLVRLDLLTPVRSVVEADGTSHITGQLFGNGHDINTGNKWFNTMFTLHGAIMAFMVIVPSIPASLGNFLLPLMLGAKDVAFPKLNLLSWYIYVFGSIFGVSSILMGGVDTGWTFYTPYSTTTDPEHWRVVLMITAAFVLGF